MSEWQPFNTVPRKTNVLLYQHDALYGPMMLVAYVYPSGGWEPAHINSYDYDCEMRAPTHWMPLPESPK